MSARAKDRQVCNMLLRLKCMPSTSVESLKFLCSFFFLKKALHLPVKTSALSTRLTQPLSTNGLDFSDHTSFCPQFSPLHKIWLGVGGLVAKLCPTLCDPMESSPPGSSVHGISQARILEWVAIFFSRDLPNPGIKPHFLHYRCILHWLNPQGIPRT